MRDRLTTREERRREAVFASWLTGGRDTYPRLRQFTRACDAGAVPGLGREDFEPIGGSDAVPARAGVVDSHRSPAVSRAGAA